MVFVRGFIVKQMKNFETKNAETISLELAIVKKSGAFFLPTVLQTLMKKIFSDEISGSLNKILRKYDNIILAGDLNIDKLRPCSNYLKNCFSDKEDIFSLEKLIKELTCFKPQNRALLYLMLTNRPRSISA